jgi:hypothetical protein
MVPAKNASTIGVVAVARTLRGGAGVPRCAAVPKLTGTGIEEIFRQHVLTRRVVVSIC